MRVPLKPDVVSLSNGQAILYTVPWIDVFLTSNHIVGPSISCYIDTGATVTIFPSGYAYGFLGYSETSLKNGVRIGLMGIGGSSTVGYGHVCTINHPEFCIENSLIFFVDNQPFPLLGRIGFMDKFKRITFDEENKFMEFIR